MENISSSHSFLLAYPVQFSSVLHIHEPQSAPPAAATALDWDAADATEGGTVSILLSLERTKPAAGFSGGAY